MAGALKSDVSNVVLFTVLSIKWNANSVDTVVCEVQ